MQHFGALHELVIPFATVRPRAFRKKGHILKNCKMSILNIACLKKAGSVQPFEHPYRSSNLASSFVIFYANEGCALLVYSAVQRRVLKI